MSKGLEALNKIIDMASEPNGYLNFQNAVDTPYYQIIEKELKKYEQYKDIEKEIGIDLITLFKALKEHNFYSKHPETGKVSWIPLPELYYCHRKWNIGCYSMIFNEHKQCCDSWDCDPKDYGKTWALTEKKLKENK